MGLLSSILVTCSELHFAIEHVEVERARTEAVVRETAQDLADAEGIEIEMPREGSVLLTLLVSGEQPVSHLIARLSEISGVVRVGSLEGENSLE